MLKQPIYYEFNLDARTSPSKLIAISHVDDKYSEVLEVAVKQNDRFVYMGGATVVARMVLHRDKDYLLSDDVTCSVNANGNILIPFDNAVVKTLQGVVKIEVNITRDTDELTLQFPLWVSVNGSILDNAEVTPESKGTIPDLLKDAADALEDATEALEECGDYENLGNKPQINGVTLSGNKTSGELRVVGWKTAEIDNCIEDGVLYSTSINNQAAYVLAKNITTDITQYAFCRDGRVMWRTRQAATAFLPAGEWSEWEEIGGADDYNDLLNKPRINQYEIKDQIFLHSFVFELEEAVLDDQTRLYIDLNRNHVFCYTNDRGSFFSIYNKHSEYMQVSQEQYEYLPIQEDGVVIRFVDDKDPNTYSNYKSYLIYFPENEGSIYLKTIIIDPQHVPYYEGPWRKVGGSHIVSGVVNQNGTITFTDSDGNTFTTTGASVIGPQGDPGNDYVLTAQDKADIADIVLQELPTTQGVLYGNSSD